MKRLFISLAILLCVSVTVSVNAQNEKKDGKRGFPMQKELNLTDDQQKQMETLGSDFKAKMKDLRDNKDLSKEDKQTKGKELRDQHMAEINKILTTEQQTKMKELAEKRGKGEMKKGDRRGQTRMHADRGEMRKPQEGQMKGLNLTDAQKEQIKALNDDFKTKSKELAEQHREALNKVYTPEQQEKLKEMKKRPARDGQFAFNGKKHNNIKLDDVSKTKIKELKENFEKEKKAVELSRIAPDAQKKKIEELRDTYRKEKRQIIKDSHKTQDSNPA